MAVDGVEGYEFKCSFDDGDSGVAINCGRKGCSFGLYEKTIDRRETKSGPGCTVCGVMAVGLNSVFDDTEEQSVPDDFKRAAAVEIVRSSNAYIAESRSEIHPVRLLSYVRPASLAMILDIAKEAGVEYEGDDLGDFSS